MVWDRRRAGTHWQTRAVIVVVCPGQGSQTPGFLRPWLEDAALASYLDELAVAADVDLRMHGTESDADTIRDTAVAQPLIVAASLLSARALENSGKPITAVAGHSVGEFAAAAIAGVLSPLEAMQLVSVRGRAMAEVAARVETGMAAVVGGEQGAVEARLGELDLTPANFNGGGQIVAAGELSALEQLRAEPPAGARVIPLQVAGAFHTHFMSPAVDIVREAAANIIPVDPSATLWTNRDGSTVSSGAEFLDLLIGQIASPVRWDACMNSFAEAGATGLIELAPAGALVGLAKRALKETPAVGIKTPEDVPTAALML